MGSHCIRLERLAEVFQRRAAIANQLLATPAAGWKVFAVRRYFRCFDTHFFGEFRQRQNLRIIAVVLQPPPRQNRS